MDPQIRDCTNEGHWKLTFPDLDYSLLGYDILSGYPLADGRDPGFKHPIFRADFSKPKQSSDCRYIFPEDFMVVPSEFCVVSFESKPIRNKQQMDNYPKHKYYKLSKGQLMSCTSTLVFKRVLKERHKSYIGGGSGFEFSASAGYKKDTAEMSSGEFLFASSHAECQNYYSTNPPPFDPGFVSWAKALVETKTKEEAVNYVMDFVKYYGTHFFTDVTYGAKFVQHHKVKQKTYETLQKSEITVEAQASYSGLFSIGGGFSLEKEQSDAASNFSKCVETTTYTVGSTPPSNGDALTWAASVSQNPVPVLYSLSPIHVLFTEPFTKRLPPDVNHTAIREKLRNGSHVYCHALRTAGMVPSCEPRFHLQSVGVDINEQGYSSLKNVDNSTCLSFCRQDENCSSVLYSELLPSLKNSNCRFLTAALI
ncbi:uncharacterized protein [Montipora foliosa]|uniref:uncharacterized protein n=1 Tax=Montipora foliosa TaxID=591990 RepID=UPI0035F1E4CD